MDAAIAFAQLLSSSPVEDLKIRVVDLCYPHHWREFFSTISRHTYHSSLKKLNLQESGNTLDPPKALYSDIGLEALTVFTNLQVVDIQPTFGIQMTSDTVNRLADAWPKIHKLSLGDAYPWSRSPIIKTEDLIPFAQRCPKLVHLGIVFDAQYTQLRSSPGLFDNSLTTLSVADSPISAPGIVAAFLSDIFPRIRWITCHDDVDPGDTIETTRMWAEAGSLLETFAKVRLQERSRMETRCD